MLTFAATGAVGKKHPSLLNMERQCNAVGSLGVSFIERRVKGGSPSAVDRELAGQSGFFADLSTLKNSDK